MVKYLNEKFDDPSARLLNSNKCAELIRRLAIEGIDIKKLKIDEYTGNISTRSPMWGMDIRHGIQNGQIFGFLFPSGYIYTAERYDNGKRIYEEDYYIINKYQYAKFYYDLSRRTVINVAKPIIISNVVPVNKDRYQDPRYVDYHYDDKQKYAGQKLGWDGWHQISGRDKSGYILQDLDALKARLFKKYSNGSIDKYLYNKFKKVGDKLRALFGRIAQLNSESIIDFSRDGYSKTNFNSYIYNMKDIQKLANQILENYKDSLDHAALQSIDGNISKYTFSDLEEINKDIDRCNNMITKSLE